MLIAVEQVTDLLESKSLKQYTRMSQFMVDFIIKKKIIPFNMRAATASFILGTYCSYIDKSPRRMDKIMNVINGYFVERFNGVVDKVINLIIANEKYITYLTNYKEEA